MLQFHLNSQLRGGSASKLTQVLLSGFISASLGFWTEGPQFLAGCCLGASLSSLPFHGAAHTMVASFKKEGREREEGERERVRARWNSQSFCNLVSEVIRSSPSSRAEYRIRYEYWQARITGVVVAYSKDSLSLLYICRTFEF